MGRKWVETRRLLAGSWRISAHWAGQGAPGAPWVGEVGVLLSSASMDGGKSTHVSSYVTNLRLCQPEGPLRGELSS